MGMTTNDNAIRADGELDLDELSAKADSLLDSMRTIVGEDGIRDIFDFDSSVDQYVADPAGDYGAEELFEAAGLVRGYNLALNRHDAAVIAQLTGATTSELIDYDDAGRAVQCWFAQMMREPDTRH
jgi:hypothetical protein